MLPPGCYVFSDGCCKKIIRPQVSSYSLPIPAPDHLPYAAALNPPMDPSADASNRSGPADFHSTGCRRCKTGKYPRQPGPASQGCRPPPGRKAAENGKTGICDHHGITRRLFQLLFGNLRVFIYPDNGNTDVGLRKGLDNRREHRPGAHLASAGSGGGKQGQESRFVAVLVEVLLEGVQGVSK